MNHRGTSWQKSQIFAPIWVSLIMNQVALRFKKKINFNKKESSEEVVALCACNSSILWVSIFWT
jgi:hypothetical protein